MLVILELDLHGAIYSQPKMDVSWAGILCADLMSIQIELESSKRILADFCSTPFSNANDMDQIRWRAALYDLHFTLKNHHMSLGATPGVAVDVRRLEERIQSHLVRLEQRLASKVELMTQQVQRLTQKALRIIDDHQRNCSQPRLLVCPIGQAPHNLGLGVKVRMTAHCLAMALGDQITPDSPWHVAQVKEKNVYAIWQRMEQMIWQEYQGQYLPNIPHSIVSLEVIQSVVETPFDWYFGVLVTYITRLSAKARSSLETEGKQVGFHVSRKLMYSLQMRGTDKCLSESICPSSAAFVKVLQTYLAIDSQVQGSNSRQAHLFLGTEDPSILETFQTSHPTLNARYRSEVASTYSIDKETVNFKSVAQNRYTSVNGTQNVLNVLIDWHLHAMARMTIGTLSSNFGAIVKFLKAAQTPSVGMVFYSLDYEWHQLYHDGSQFYLLKAKTNHSDPTNTYLGFNVPENRLAWPIGLDPKEISLQFQEGDLIELAPLV
eukprot:maker-scaffold409_size180341-snap-gene-0.29 protein:Tk00893 transcript:maker-scaffold409_size180341-snap-gene-0.29-mRNA-1 annotation:"cre-fut-8 protein"